MVLHVCSALVAVNPAWTQVDSAQLVFLATISRKMVDVDSNALMSCIQYTALKLYAYHAIQIAMAAHPILKIVSVALVIRHI